VRGKDNKRREKKWFETKKNINISSSIASINGKETKEKLILSHVFLASNKKRTGTTGTFGMQEFQVGERKRIPNLPLTILTNMGIQKNKGTK